MNFLYSFFYYQFTVLSSHAQNGHQMYFGGSVVGKASTIGIGISLTPTLVFTGGSKVQNLASFTTSLNFEPPAFENASNYPTCETRVQCCDDRSLHRQVWWSWVYAPLRKLCQLWSTAYNCMR